MRWSGTTLTLRRLLFQFFLSCYGRVMNMGLSYYIKNVVVIILIVVYYCKRGYVNGSSEISNLGEVSSQSE